ncbi:MAG TPA: hypothetical protein VH416_05955, partial [Gaiellaceae bacterium]
YVDRVLSFVDVDAIEPLKLVADAANGMGGTMLPPVLERLPQLEVVRCFFEPDGTFPNHEPNPLLPENREFIVKRTLEEGANLGVAFDGDADRCFFVDDTGEFVPGDFATALFAESVLEKEPGAKIIYDVRASWAVPETIERGGGVPLVNRVGHAFIKQRMREEGADLGVAFDGDADRCFFVDDTGEFVPGDFATALFAESVLEKEPGAKIIYDVRASWAVPETIERAGGVPLVNRVGHAFIKQRMREEGAAFGGEVSGHYYFRDFSQADTGVVPFLLMLELVSRKRARLSEILKPFRDRYFITGELNTPVADVDAKLRELEERFGPEGRVSHLDGLSVDAEDWHMNVRPSNTEPLLRLNLEARTPELTERKRDEVLAVIRDEA